MLKTRVGVLRGGPSSEYEVSLKTGEAVLKNLPDHYEPVDIFVDRDGYWYVHGIKHEPPKALHKVDVVWNAMHGEFGEDGQVQELMDNFGVKYTGSKAFPSRLAINKGLTKDFLKKVGVKTPIYKVLDRVDFSPRLAATLYQTFPQPSIVKPLSLGSAYGVALASGMMGLNEALKQAFDLSEKVLIEEFIAGKEATCAVVENFLGERYHVLPPIEIVLKSTSGLFDYDAMYNGLSEQICPGRFSTAENAELARIAKIAHQTLGLDHYSRSDFIIHPRRGIYFLEINSLPGLTEVSLLPKALSARGSSFSDFLDHVIKMALGRK